MGTLSIGLPSKNCKKVVVASKTNGATKEWVGLSKEEWSKAFQKRRELYTHSQEDGTFFYGNK